MTIVFLNPVGVLGGAEWCLHDLLSVIRVVRPEWKLHLIAGSDGSLVEAVAKLGVEAQVVSFPASLAGLGDSGVGAGQRGRAGRALRLAGRAGFAFAALPGFIRRLSRAIAAVKPKLLHSNGLKCHFVAAHASPRGVPITWHIHDFLSSRVVVGKALRRLARRPDAAIAVSQAVKQDAVKVLPGTRVETVYNGIDIEHFSPGAAANEALDSLASMPQVPQGGVRVGLVATYARWKGQEVLIDAAARLAERNDLPPIRCYVVGSPIYQTAGSQFSEVELRTRIRDRGLEHAVGLIPFQRDLPPVYRSLDVVVHASTKPEPFGRTIVEAMACGRPVVVANAGGAAELFTHGVDAVGVSPGDPRALADAIAALVLDPARRAKLGEAARTTASARFSRARMGERVLEIYDSLLNRATS